MVRSIKPRVQNGFLSLVLFHLYSDKWLWVPIPVSYTGVLSKAREYILLTMFLSWMGEKYSLTIDSWLLRSKNLRIFL
jgi:hypothetical protein